MKSYYLPIVATIAILIGVPLIKEHLFPLQKGTMFLISPFQASDNNLTPGEVKLIDFKGKIYKSWKTKYQPFYSMFDNKGNLYVAEMLPAELSTAPIGGLTGLIEKFSPKGEVIWSYTNPDMHHDFDVLPNGHILITVLSKLDDAYAQRIQGGLTGKENGSWSDTIMEIDEDKKVVWSWKYEDHINPKDFTLTPFTPRSEFTHTNSVKYYDTNPINHKPSVLINSRHLSTVFLVDKESGTILWQSPKGMFSFEHDASLNNKEGTVMVFDNGLFRKTTRAALISSIIKVDIKTNKIVWVFTGGKTGIEKTAFSSSIMGGAQELENGDILATVAVQGKVMEISKERKLISQYINTYLGSPTEEGIPNNVLFKVMGYDSDFIYKKVLTGFHIF